MADWRDTDTDLPHNLLVWEDGLPAAYIRLTVIDTPYHRPACISGLRVFGRGYGSAPAPVTEAKAIHSDGMSMNVTWKEVSSYNEISLYEETSFHVTFMDMPSEWMAFASVTGAGALP